MFGGSSASAAPSWPGQGITLVVWGTHTRVSLWDRLRACSQRSRCSFPAPVADGTGKTNWMPWRRARPLAPHPGSLSGLFVPPPAPSPTALPSGADTDGSGPLSGTEEVTSPAPVPAVPDWAIALLVLVCILLLLNILTCFLMVRPPSLSSPAFCWWVPCPRPHPFMVPDPFPLPPRPPAPAAGKAEGSWTCSAQRIPTTPWPSTHRTRATAATCHPTASPTPTAR